MKNMEIIALSSDDKDHERIIKFLKFGMDYVKKNLKESKEILRNKEKTESILISDKKFKNEKLINVDEIVYSSFSKLENVKRTTFEMETISLDVSKGVYENTEKIKNAKGKLLDINTELSTSNSLISRMLRREYRNKILISMFALTLIITLLTIIYMKFFNSTGEPTTESTEIPTPGKRRFLYIKN
jgi:hypothetical protein